MKVLNLVLFFIVFSLGAVDCAGQEKFIDQRIPDFSSIIVFDTTRLSNCYLYTFASQEGYELSILYDRLIDRKKIKSPERLMDMGGIIILHPSAYLLLLETTILTNKSFIRKFDWYKFPIQASTNIYPRGKRLKNGVFIGVREIQGLFVLGIADIEKLSTRLSYFFSLKLKEKKHLIGAPISVK